MSDLVWIEHIGGRMMGTLGITAPNDTLREIYSYFHAEEQRHANAEIALMRRWGMLAEGEIPPQSGDIKALLQALRGFDNLGDRRLPFVYMATVIPFFEVGLDGAVLKFCRARSRIRCSTRCSPRSTPTNHGIWQSDSRLWICWAPVSSPECWWRMWRRCSSR